MNTPQSHRPPLIVEQVTKRFHQGPSVVSALDNANLQVNGGEFIAIMGASGSGKSTMLHAAAGLTHIDSGRILVGGQDLSALSDAALTRFRRRHIGLVFQAFNLIPTLTAEDNIRLPAMGLDGVEQRLDELLRRLDISDRRGHRPDALSGGEQQRVAIARALITNPDIVLADEPTGSLDSVTGQSLCRLLRELCDEQSRTIIVVTHEPSVAMWADRVVILRDGTDVATFETHGEHDAQALTQYYHDALAAEPVS